jgi:hypothetical protein
MATNNFEPFPVNTRIKLSALWTSVMFCYIYGDYFELYVPKKVEGLISGENLLDSPMKLFAAAVLLAVPACMIFLSLLLKPKINRILNLSFGIFYTALMLLIALMSITKWLSFYVFFAIVESIITSLVIWQALTWKRSSN